VPRGLAKEKDVSAGGGGAWSFPRGWPATGWRLWRGWSCTTQRRLLRSLAASASCAAALDPYSHRRRNRCQQAVLVHALLIDVRWNMPYCTIVHPLVSLHMQLCMYRTRNPPRTGDRTTRPRPSRPFGDDAVSWLPMLFLFIHTRMRPI